MQKVGAESFVWEWSTWLAMCSVAKVWRPYGGFWVKWDQWWCSCCVESMQCCCERHKQQRMYQTVMDLGFHVFCILQWKHQLTRHSGAFTLLFVILPKPEIANSIHMLVSQFCDYLSGVFHFIRCMERLLPANWENTEPLSQSDISQTWIPSDLKSTQASGISPLKLWANLIYTEFKQKFVHHHHERIIRWTVAYLSLRKTLSTLWKAKMSVAHAPFQKVNQVKQPLGTLEARP